MYTPHFNALDSVADIAEIRALVAAAGSGQLITVGADGYPQATLLPLLWRGDTVVAHFARANAHWQDIADAAPALVAVVGPEAYVSPGWYAAKSEHGRVVPTWNYSAVQLRGRVTVRHEPEWLLEAVSALTDVHEGGRAEPWQVTDAPQKYVAGQLRGIVGVEFVVEAVFGKAKLSQNRSEADQAGVVAGLAAEEGVNVVRGAHVMAQGMCGCPAQL